MLEFLGVTSPDLLRTKSAALRMAAHMERRQQLCSSRLWKHGVQVAFQHCMGLAEPLGLGG